MTDITNILQTLAALLSSIVSLIGLIYIIKQLKQINTSIRSQEHSSIFNMALDLNKMLIENQEFIPIFMDNAPIDKNDSNYNKVKIMVLMCLDFYEYIFAEKDFLSLEMRNTWLEFIQHIYCTNGVLRDLIDEHQNFLDTKFVSFIKEKYLSQMAEHQ